MPVEFRGDLTSVAGCGAVPTEKVAVMLAEAGYAAVAVELEAESDAIVGQWDDEHDILPLVQSTRITAWEPDG